MSHHHHGEGSAVHGLAGLAILGSILLLPSAILIRAIKRLAILVGIFALIVVGLLTAFNLSKPVCSLGPYINSPTSNDPQLCRENAEKRSAEAKAALDKLEAALERDRPLKP
jgi:hypothetical protein